MRRLAARDRLKNQITFKDIPIANRVGYQIGMTRQTQVPKRRRSRAASVLQIFISASPRRAAIVTVLLLLAGFAESIGYATLLPVLSVFMGDAAGQPSQLQAIVSGALSWVGIPLDSLIILLAVVVACAWLKAAVMQLGNVYVGNEMAQVATGLRLRLIDTLLNVKWSYFTRQPVGRFANSISNEAARAAEAYYAAAMFVTTAVQTIIYLILTLVFSWQVGLLSLLIGFAITWMLRPLVRISRKAGRQQTQLTQSLVARLTDTLTGIKPLKAMAKHVRISALFAADARAVNETLRRQVVAKQGVRNLQEPILWSFGAAILLIAHHFTDIPFSVLLVMGALLFRVVITSNKVQQNYQMAVIAESAYWTMQETIREAHGEQEVNVGVKIPTLKKACVFDRVSFAYGDKTVLRDVSFEFSAGVITAITGASGAGKTTIADLILGLMSPTSGTIRLDDVPLAEVDLIRWREMVGYVPQDVILFHDTVLANVTLGDPNLTAADAEAVLRSVDAWDFVAQLPQGLQTVAGERGSLLSGGQRQRIALARALIHRPALVILDEATSALDPETESAICQSLKSLSGKTGLTILAISHQPAWVEAAHRVFRLERQQVSPAIDEPRARAAAS
jgi:ATP-binding cassette, subfamily C, bacterial